MKSTKYWTSSNYRYQEDMDPEGIYRVWVIGDGDGPIEEFTDEKEFISSCEERGIDRFGIVLVPTETYSDFSLYFDEHDDEFIEECDYIDAEGHGFVVHLHVQTGRYYYESIDENNAEVHEVEKLGSLTYEWNSAPPEDVDLSVVYPDNDVCGETVNNDYCEYAWYKIIKK